MTEEFNLSERILEHSEELHTGRGYSSEPYLDVENVKEFIRLLKEELSSDLFSNTFKTNLIHEAIDKLAGGDLI